MAENRDLDFLYGPIKLKMKELISHINYSTYIDKLVPVDVDGRFIVLETSTESFAKYITGTLADKMREAIVKANVGLSDFRLKVEGSDDFAYNAPDEEEFSVPTNLDPRYTFESFVVGKNNEFVHAAALSVAEDPAGDYNPLFIYGGTGLGKTHLIQAIGNKIAKEKPNLKIIYVTCDQFFNEIIDSMLGHGVDARNKGNRMRQRYRTADVLIIDDIQFIAKKKAVQEEFFHIFNELVSKGKQIVISSDQPPKELTELEERLRTRFSGGLLFDILPPNLETKIAILKRKAFENKCLVPDDVLVFLAQDSGDDVRTLEGRLKKVIFASRLHEQPITVALAGMALNEAVSESGTTKEEITPDNIISAVSSFYRISKNDLLGKSKKREIVIPRQICGYLMLELLSLPLSSVGKILGRDHTTMMHSRDKVEEMCRLNDKIAKDVDDIKNIILKK